MVRRNQPNASFSSFASVKFPVHFCSSLWLAQILRPYGIKPKTIWIGDQAAKGYLEDDFTETFQRYIARTAALAYVNELRASGEKEEEPKAEDGEPVQDTGCAEPRAACDSGARWRRETAA
jgi:hypothetical protein